MNRFAAILGLCVVMGIIPSLLAQTTSPANVVRADADQIARSELTRRSDRAIRQGVKFLLSRQNADGSWSNAGPPDLYAPGRTALVALALLYCGESHQSPPLDRAIKYLKKAQPQTTRVATYSIALRAAVYASLPESIRREELRTDLRWLQQALITIAENRGMYAYTRDPESGADFSNSQYGALGVWYAAMAGLEIPKSYWKQVEDAWRRGQNDDGGWPYRYKNSVSSSSMTAAAAATLFITQDYLHSEQALDLTKIWINKPLDDAIKWLGNNFAVDQNAGYDRIDPRQADEDVLNLIGNIGRRGTWVHYMLFGYERVGEASGLTRLGTHKWFDEGAAYLVRTQQPDGSWTGVDGSEVSTAYSLLFLSRGRAPVVVQKLQFNGRWNNRPRDAAGFTQFMRRATERHVNWQSLSIDASADEFRQAPLLYIASDRPLSLSNEQKFRIKSYLDQGGMLICANDGRTDLFAKSVVQLVAEWYPGYSFRDLPQDHVVRSINFPISATEKIRVLGNGVRELIALYPEGDMSWKWHSSGGEFGARNSPYASLADFWLYMTDRANPRFKGEDTWISQDPLTQANRNASIARIQYEGNWNPEPAGWVRMANVMHNDHEVNLSSEPTASPAAKSLLAHLTGTTAPKLSAESQRALRTYIDSGGMLLMDAAGSSADAVAGFESLLRTLYPTVLFTPLPLDHPIYRGSIFGGVEIANNINYRRSAGLGNVHIPRLRGATVDGKLVAIISNEDLSAALVGYSIAGLAGYTPMSGTDLVRNLILWRMSLVAAPNEQK